MSAASGRDGRLGGSAPTIRPAGPATDSRARVPGPPDDACRPDAPVLHPMPRRSGPEGGSRRLTLHRRREPLSRSARRRSFGTPQGMRPGPAPRSGTALPRGRRPWSDRWTRAFEDHRSEATSRSSVADRTVRVRRGGTPADRPTTTTPDRLRTCRLPAPSTARAAIPRADRRRTRNRTRAAPPGRHGERHRHDRSTGHRPACSPVSDRCRRAAAVRRPTVAQAPVRTADRWRAPMRCADTRRWWTGGETAPDRRRHAAWGGRIAR